MYEHINVCVYIYIYIYVCVCVWEMYKYEKTQGIQWMILFIVWIICQHETFWFLNQQIDINRDKWMCYGMFEINKYEHR